MLKLLDDDWDRVVAEGREKKFKQEFIHTVEVGKVTPEAQPAHVLKLSPKLEQQVNASKSQAGDLNSVPCFVLNIDWDECKGRDWGVKEKDEGYESVPDEVDTSDWPHISDQFYHALILEEF